MRYPILFAVAATTVVVVGLSTTSTRAASRPAAADVKTASDGVYTDEQATRGEVSYTKDCAFCHSADLQGDSFAPALIEETFRLRWKDSTLGELFTILKGTMPADKPGALADEDYAGIVAYLLKMNKYPAGPEALSTDAAVLKQIAFSKSEARSQP